MVVARCSVIVDDMTMREHAAGQRNRIRHLERDNPIELELMRKLENFH